MNDSRRARANGRSLNSCAWTTFPERLEDLGVSWMVYQNEISSVDVGFKDEEGLWLANFGSSRGPSSRHAEEKRYR